MRTWLIIGALAAAAALACSPDRRDTLSPCPPEDPECVDALGCTPEEADFVYRRRIEPLLNDGRPSSCNQCHLTGIDLEAISRGNPCNTMSCLIEQELVDLANPDASRILDWIEKGEPHPEMVGAARAEYDGFRAWIVYSARCHAEVCGEIDQPCGPPAPMTRFDAGPPDAEVADAAAPDGQTPDAVVADAGVSDASPVDADLDAEAPADASPPDAAADADHLGDRGALADGGAVVDDGPCGPETRLTVFHERVMGWRQRCGLCHAADGITAGVGGAPIWMIDEPDRASARETMANVLAAPGWLDHQDPSQSLFLLKPLHRASGGVRHGGGNKFLSLEDPGYLDFLMWVDRHVRCEEGIPLEGPFPVPDAEVPDAEVPDAEVPDAEVPDEGVPDAGAPDAGGLDAEAPDAGAAQGGP